MKKLFTILFVMLTMVLTSCSNDASLEYPASSLTKIFDGANDLGPLQVYYFQTSKKTEFTEYFYVIEKNTSIEMYFESTTGEYFVLRQTTDAETGKEIFAAYVTRELPADRGENQVYREIVWRRTSVTVKVKLADGGTIQQCLSITNP